jgi:hypothetical protein
MGAEGFGLEVSQLGSSSPLKHSALDKITFLNVAILIYQVKAMQVTSQGV